MRYSAAFLDALRDYPAIARSLGIKILPRPRRARYFMPPFGAPFQAPIVTSGGAVVVPWYLAGGVALADCAVAYQPIGAASLATSYVNLAHPGTNDAAPGTAPNFNAATGWGFTGGAGNKAYLLCGASVPNTTDWSYLVQFASSIMSEANTYPLTSADVRLELRLSNAPSWLYVNNKYTEVGRADTGGNMCIAGMKGYINGAYDVDILTNLWGAAPNSSLVIGRYGSNDVGYFNGVISAVAIYSVTLTAPQVAAISAAMALL